MYKKIFMGIAARAALTLVSCSSDDLNSFSDNHSKNEAISFDGYLGRSAVAVNGSRGSVLDIDALKGTDSDKKGFGVFGYYNSSVTDHGSAPEQSFDANLFNNEQVSCPKDGADWAYTPLKYWPADGHVDFLAYAPYVNGKTLKENSSSIDFAVSETIANQTDLLWANAENKTKDNLSSEEKNKVKFQFGHALSRLGYSVKLNRAVSESDATITLNKITLAGSKDQAQNAFYKEGTIDLATGNWSTSSSTDPNYNDTKRNFEWFSDKNKQPSEKTLSSEDDKAIKNSGNEYLFVIPQKFKTGSDHLYVIVEYTIEYKSGTAQPTVSYNVSQQLQYDFEQGKAYTINLNIGLTPIEFNAEVNDWEPKDGESIDASWK